MSKQCSFLKADMSQCQAYCIDGSDFCLSHDPNQKEEKLAAVRKGGAADSYQSLKLSLPAFSIQEPHDVVPAVVQTINELREGKLPPRIANTVGYLLGVALKAFEVAEIDEKLEAIDRITRNYRDAVAMDDLRLDCDKELHFVYDRLVIDKSTVGRDIVDWDLKVFLAKQYLNRLKEDAKNSAMYKLRNMEWPQGAPFGYKNITQEDKKKWIVIDPFNGKVVEKIYEWYSSGSFSMKEVRDKANEMFGLKFSKGYIDFILKNKFYMGIMVYDEKEYPHKYERLISPELFEKVQQVKAGYNKKHFKYAGLPYIYRGLIRCKVCGCMITPEKKKGKYVYYHCTQYNGKHENAKWVNEEELTNQFKAYFSGFEMPQDVVEDITESVRAAHKDKSYFHKTLLDNYNAEYQKYETMIENAYEDKLSGSITESYYNKTRDKLREKQKKLQQNMGKLQIADEEYYITSDYILDLAKRAPELYESSEPIEKRQLLKFTLQNLQLDGSLACYDEIKPFDTIRLYASRQAWLPLIDMFRNREIGFDISLTNMKMFYEALGLHPLA